MSMYINTALQAGGVTFTMQKYNGSPSHPMRKRVCIVTCVTVTQAGILCQVLKSSNCDCSSTKFNKHCEQFRVTRRRHSNKYSCFTSHKNLTETDISATIQLPSSVEWSDHTRPRSEPTSQTHLRSMPHQNAALPMQ